ncbi:MAG TPA: hypothetical protein VFO72_07460, partial [Pyrinomonadaceae bacterium]|nr:hypothetical protein [Pyrinomonadaceae bacterium]
MEKFLWIDPAGNSGELDCRLPIANCQLPIADLRPSALLKIGNRQSAIGNINMSEAEQFGFDIAVVGLAGRFPRARNLDEFWK